VYKGALSGKKIKVSEGDVVIWPGSTTKRVGKRALNKRGELKDIDLKHPDFVGVWTGGSLEGSALFQRRRSQKPKHQRQEGANCS